jgi:ATP-dependent Clp protease ATP-binding subunit ClpC
LFERWTERARQVAVLAQDEARKVPSIHIGTEHLLLGCMVEEEGIAAKVLAHLELSADDLRNSISPSLTAHQAQGQIPFSPTGKKVLELSLREALSQGHNYIGTEHLLYALVRDPDTQAANYLKAKLGKQYAEIIRLELDELLKGPRPSRGEVDLNEEERRELKLKDVLVDLLTGFNMWKEAKQLNSEEWTDNDEAFSRWIEGAGVGEFL